VTTTEHPWQIVIAERGFIFAGRVTREADNVVIRDAFTVRRYSLNTHDGLGGLAGRAPQKDNDVLDAQPTTRVHVLAMIAAIDCDDAAWSKWHAQLVKAQAKR
jgi:hypothetical protein